MRWFDLEHGTFTTPAAPWKDPTPPVWSEDDEHRRIVARRPGEVLVDGGRELDPLFSGPLVWTKAP